MFLMIIAFGFFFNYKSFIAAQQSKQELELSWNATRAIPTQNLKPKTCFFFFILFYFGFFFPSSVVCLCAAPVAFYSSLFFSGTFDQRTQPSRQHLVVVGVTKGVDLSRQHSKPPPMEQNNIVNAVSLQPGQHTPTLY